MVSNGLIKKRPETFEEEEILRLFEMYAPSVHGARYGFMPGRVLDEGQGVPNSIIDISRKVANYTFNEIGGKLKKYSDIGYQYFVVRIPQEVIGDDTFITNLDMRLYVKVFDNNKECRNAIPKGADDEKGEYNMKSAKLSTTQKKTSVWFFGRKTETVHKLDGPIISMDVPCTYDSLFDVTQRLVYHEFTHAYQDFCEMIDDEKNGNEGIGLARKYEVQRGNYGKIQEFMKSDNELMRYLGLVFYYCDESERNAITSQTYAECLSLFRSYTYDISYQSLVMNLNVYGIIVTLKRLVSLIKKYASTNPDEVLSRIIEISGRDETRNVNRALKWLESYVNFSINFYVEHVSRVIERCYRDNFDNGGCGEIYTMVKNIEKLMRKERI